MSLPSPLGLENIRDVKSEWTPALFQIQIWQTLPRADVIESLAVNGQTNYFLMQNQHLRITSWFAGLCFPPASPLSTFEVWAHCHFGRSQALTSRSFWSFCPPRPIAHQNKSMGDPKVLSNFLNWFIMWYFQYLVVQGAYISCKVPTFYNSFVLSEDHKEPMNWNWLKGTSQNQKYSFNYQICICSCGCTLYSAHCTVCVTLNVRTI